MSEYVLYRAEDLKRYIVQFMQHHDVSAMDSATVADVLISADLRGVSSHGIIRLDTYYGSRIRKGLIDPHSPLTVDSETMTTLRLDGGKGLGHVVGKFAMTRCIEKAQEAGISMVTVHNSNHYGIAGYYAMMALSHDMIGISFTNAQPLVAPTYGRAAILGTNPIAVAVPGKNEQPYVLDMATSIVPIGKITVFDKAGQPIPAGWGINQEGLVTTDPKEVLSGGALLPLGGTAEMRGYKGYGLAMMVDIFSGVLSGAAIGREVGRTGENRPADVGHFFCAIRIDAFRPLEEFKQDMDRIIRMMKESPKAVGEDRIYIAGEKEFELAEQYAREGIPLLTEVVRSLEKSGNEVNVPFDLQPVGTLEQ